MSWRLSVKVTDFPDNEILPDSPKIINCPDCNKEISAKAITCPQCGSPINYQSLEHKIKTSSSPFAIACILTSGIVLFTPLIFINFIVVGSVVLGIFSLARKEKLMFLAVAGIIISLLSFFSANKQMDDARLKLEEAQHDLENLQRRLR